MFKKIINWVKKSYIINETKVSGDKTVDVDVDFGVIDEMFQVLSQGSDDVRPSKYWDKLNEMNIAQLRKYGYKNFKRTLAVTYFTSILVMPWDPQIVFMCKELGWTKSFKYLKMAFTSPKHNFFSRFNYIQSIIYNFIVYMTWAYAQEIDRFNLLPNLEEPDYGGPIDLFIGSKRISQDIASSLIEFTNVVSNVEDDKEIKTVLELGAGYGRTGYVFKKSHIGNDMKYIFVDIAPALYISQTYISKVFPDKKVFTFRNFKSFSEIETEFNDADFVFLLTTQLSHLPNNIVDLIVNISSLHEMTRKQINYYFKEFDRLLKHKGYFYFKQWKSGDVLFEDDNATIKENEYPIPKHWQKVFWMTSKPRPNFFEAMLLKNYPTDL